MLPGAKATFFIVTVTPPPVAGVEAAADDELLELDDELLELDDELLELDPQAASVSAARISARAGRNFIHRSLRQPAPRQH
jgi:hypothetical protein